jgi:hypothetical protein
MHDNKLRLSSDVLEKAEQIAVEWGLKNARAAVEAVFRKYADDYLYGRQSMFATAVNMENSMVPMPEMRMAMVGTESSLPSTSVDVGCAAASELDSLLGL